LCGIGARALASPRLSRWVSTAWTRCGSLDRDGLASIEIRHPEAFDAWTGVGLRREAVAVVFVGFAGRVVKWLPAPPSSLA
jgi:hypothetical protein